MALNIGGSGNVRPYCKYNAKSDKWFVRGADGQDQEIQRPTFVIDFDNIATGWLRFREGQAPERVIDQAIDRPAPLPDEGFKRGFVVMGFSPKFFGGIAEFASASIHLSNAIKDLYSIYEVERDKNSGKLPVIACTGSQAMKDRYGTNYRPVFNLASWVDRPAEMPNESPVSPTDVWQGAAPQIPRSTAVHVPAPGAKADLRQADPLAEPVF